MSKVEALVVLLQAAYGSGPTAGGAVVNVPCDSSAPTIEIAHLRKLVDLVFFRDVLRELQTRGARPWVLANPMNLNLAIRHPENKVKALGSLQSLGMLTAIGLFASGLFTVFRSFLQAGKLIGQRNRLNLIVLKWVQLATKHVELLAPEFSSGRSLTVFCVDDEKP